MSRTALALGVAAAAWWGAEWLAATTGLDLFAPVLLPAAVFGALGALEAWLARGRAGARA